MTGIAIGRRPRVPGRVTVGAGCRGMFAGQWKLRDAVVKIGRFPGRSGVTRRAVVAEVAQYVIWVFD